MIEVEIRGPLNNKQRQSIETFLRKVAKLEKTSSQYTIFFRNIPTKSDLRLRWDSAGDTRLVVKKGTSNQTARREIEIELKPFYWKQALRFLITLGFYKGQVGKLKRWDYKYRSFKIAIRSKTVIGDHFEIELLVNSKNQIQKAEKQLKEFAKKLKLRIWSEKEYRDLLKRKWSKIPIKDLRQFI